MKYCLFEGGDVVGPFLADELLTKKGFDGHSLVCPEEHSEEEVFWKEAYLYDEFGLQPPEPIAADCPEEEEFPSEMRHSVEQWKTVEDKSSEKMAEEELNTEPAISLTQAEQEMFSDPTEDKMQISSLLLRAPRATAPAETSVAVQEANIPATREEVVAQLVSASPNPIEEYFNSIRSGDLGNILGIPDPKASSDMNLARAIEKQFEKTDSDAVLVPAKKEDIPQDTFAQNLIAPTETFSSVASNATPEEKDAATQAQLQQESTAEKKPEINLSAVENEENPAASAATTDPALVVAAQADDPTDETVSTILDGSLKVDNAVEELAEPIKRIEAKDEPKELSAFEQGRVVTPATAAEPETSTMKGVWLVVAAIFVLVGGLLFAWNEEKNVISSKSTTTQTVAAMPAAARTAVEPAAVAVKTPEEQAQEIVQNYVLDNQRGTVADYLNRHYAQQLASGYSADWSAEPLHRNVYVVKYRLSKTRQEPIVYIFQADTAKKKLTGALNNITLDLVGKIK
ncbi:MAG: hypothetical protein J6U96_02960 [Elusimicrobiaceae bacterium]|nr:hypothetical protein [Elusimicrobiaceae bacterium]